MFNLKVTTTGSHCLGTSGMTAIVTGEEVSLTDSKKLPTKIMASHTMTSLNIVPLATLFSIAHSPTADMPGSGWLPHGALGRFTCRR